MPFYQVVSYSQLFFWTPGILFGQLCPNEPFLESTTSYFFLHELFMKDLLSENEFVLIIFEVTLGHFRVNIPHFKRD